MENIKDFKADIVDPVEIIHDLIDNNSGFLAFGTVSSLSPRPIRHHFGELSEKDISDNISGELFREDSKNDGWPFLSLVQVTFVDRTPLILMSDMTDHTRNIINDNRVSLLIDGTTGKNRMDSGRVALMGYAFKVDKAEYRDIYLAQHPSATAYFDFSDFRLYTVEITHARLNAGFGKAFWLNGDEIIGDIGE